MFWSITVYRGAGTGVPCGDHEFRGRTRRIQRPEQVAPTGNWWQRLTCRLFAHQLACCPNHTTYVYWPPGVSAGIICERCGAVIAQRTGW